MFGVTEKIGRPGGIPQTAKGIYKVAVDFGSSNPATAHEIISTIAFGDPFIQVSPGSSYTVKLQGLYRYRSQFLSPNVTFLRVRLRDSQVGNYPYDVTESHNQTGQCQDAPLLAIAPSFILNSSQLGSDKRINVDCDIGGTIGRTTCLKSFVFELLFKLNSGSITNIRDGETWNTKPVTVKKIT